ncbi:MAG: serine/threonine protein kinase [Deltaproteobacteria bacterium]|nr:serine/threonine protein kinase [Deltaproteobacteria bacterium]
MAQAEVFPSRFGPFTLLRLLGAGGMGKAYLARHPDWPTLLVVKRMHAHFLEDQTSFKRFVHEAKVASYVRHPSVAAMVAMGTSGKEPFFATEHVFGIGAEEVIDDLRSKKARMPLPVALYLSLDLVKGIEAIHEAVDTETGEPLGLIHRDIGSRNALIGFDGGLRIIDLGLGRSMLADWHTAANVIAGSPDYMPPEQAVGRRVDRRADVYAAAVVVWELITGLKRIDEPNIAKRIARAVHARPESLVEHRPDASRDLEAALMQAMASDMEDRTPIAQTLREALERELARLGSDIHRDDVVKWLGETYEPLRKRRGDEIAEAEREAADDTEEPADRTRILAAQPALFQRAPQQTRPMSHDLSATDPAPPKLSARVLERAFEMAATTRKLARELVATLREEPVWMKGTFAAMSVLVVGLSLAVFSGPRPAPPPPPRPPARPAIAPEPPPVEAPRPPPPEPLPLTPPSPPSEVEDPELDPPPEAAAPAPELGARKRSLTERMKRLRRARFDVAFQRQLTRLGQQLTRAKTEREIDEVEGRLRRLERE